MESKAGFFLWLSNDIPGWVIGILISWLTIPIMGSIVPYIQQIARVLIMFWSLLSCVFLEGTHSQKKHQPQNNLVLLAVWHPDKRSDFCRDGYQETLAK